MELVVDPQQAYPAVFLLQALLKGLGQLQHSRLVQLQNLRQPVNGNRLAAGGQNRLYDCLVLLDLQTLPPPPNNFNFLVVLSSSIRTRFPLTSSSTAKKVATSSDFSRLSSKTRSYSTSCFFHRHLSTWIILEDTDTILWVTIPEKASGGGGSFRFPLPAAF